MKFCELYRIFSKIISKKIWKISRNTSNIFEKYLGKFREIFSKKNSDNILETFENCFGISWKNLRNFRELFQKVSRNTAEILEKYFKNFENYCGEFGELFLKIILKIISAMFKNQIKQFWNISDIFEKYFGKSWEILPKKVSNNVLVNFENFFENFRKISKKKSENFEVYCG